MFGYCWPTNVGPQNIIFYNDTYCSIYSLKLSTMIKQSFIFSFFLTLLFSTQIAQANDLNDKLLGKWRFDTTGMALTLEFLKRNRLKVTVASSGTTDTTTENYKIVNSEDNAISIQLKGETMHLTFLNDNEIQQKINNNKIIVYNKIN